MWDRGRRLWDMASIRYLVSGLNESGERVRQRFSDDPKSAREFGKTLKDLKTTYEVRTRINGRQISKTFDRKLDADTFAAQEHINVTRGTSVDPRNAKVTIQEYGTNYLAKRTDLAMTTRETYELLFENHIVPELGKIAVGKLDLDKVRSWNRKLADRLPTTAAKAYRLLRQIMYAAMKDRLRNDNPCQVPNAGTEPEGRSVTASIPEVKALVEAMPPNLRLVVLVATWTALRRGELLALRRKSFDLDAREVEIVKSEVITPKTRMQIRKEPKSIAGRRVLSLPPNMVEAVEAHLDTFVGASPESPVFDTTPHKLRRAWERARESIGRNDLNMHDLRGVGLTQTGIGGATTKELMFRAGHSTPAMVLRYQRATKDRDRALADRLAVLVEMEMA